MEKAEGIITPIISTQGIALICIFIFGLYALCRTFSQMKRGFGVFNVRIFGIIIVATMVSILGIVTPSSLSASIGILGAIAGYLFGHGTPSNQASKETESK